MLNLILESQLKKNLRVVTPGKSLVAPFSCFKKIDKKISVGEPLSKLQLLFSLGFPKEAKSEIIDKF